MNELDKKNFKALSFFADNTRTKVMNIREENRTEYDESVPEDINAHLTELGYIDGESDSKYIITQKGLKELRTLEEIKYRDRVIIATTIAVIVSIISLLKSYGAI